MLQQIDNIIYNVVYHNTLSTDLFNEFSNIINELNDDNNTNADIKNKAIKLNQFLRKCRITPLNIYLEPNNLINEKISQIIENNIFKKNIQLSQNDISNISYKTIIKYIIQNETTKIDKDKLYDIEPITDDEMKQFIDTFNNMISQKTLISILQFIFYNNFISCYNKLIDDKFSQLEIPINIYNTLVDKDVQDNINTQRYKDIYSTLLELLKKDNEQEYIEYFKQNISNIDIKEGIKDAFLKKQIDVDKDVFKTNKLTVSKFLENIQNLDVITNEQFINWNKLLSDTLLSLTENSEELKDSIEEIKYELTNYKVDVVIDKDKEANKVKKVPILCKDIFKLFSTEIKTLSGHEKGDDSNLSIGEHIINELQEELNLVLNNNLKEGEPKIQIINKNNSFFKSFDLLISNDNTKIISFFKQSFSNVNNSNISKIYETILTYIKKSESYTWLSVFYTLMYYIKRIKVESVLYFRNNDVYLFEGEQNDTENLIDKAYKYIEKKEGTDKTLTKLAQDLYSNTANNQDNVITDQNKGNDASSQEQLPNLKTDSQIARDLVIDVENS